MPSSRCCRRAAARPSRKLQIPPRDRRRRARHRRAGADPPLRRFHRRRPCRTSTIERGEIFGFLGSNGCGKTTTMKMLTGLLPASDGEAPLFGRPVEAGDMESRTRVGYMSQILLALCRTDRPPESRSARAPVPLASGRGRRRASRNWSRRFGLAGHRRCSSPPTFRSASGSGCRSPWRSCTSPDLLILDEPTSGVDPLARDEFWRAADRPVARSMA